ncbi:hypothetical protein HOLleu_04758 [Holothuria leucospilota]|uniref:Uncharacterized protein n=1 Tax=Holothuria leucospilota TaxID=206669 RepID=A0A9Q1HE31_HOLLE|nr:hypothetical protein HOLleu_04758 [Holothuria leucospilota]
MQLAPNLSRVQKVSASYQFFVSLIVYVHYVRILSTRTVTFVLEVPLKKFRLKLQHKLRLWKSYIPTVLLSWASYPSVLSASSLQTKEEGLRALHL